MAGRIDYEERKETRIEHLQSAADKAAERSHHLNEESSRMMSAIPMGQPIITGRGSRTTADINYRNRAWNKMEKSVEESEKSSYYADRAASAESNKSISSDDPDAISKLKEKLAGLETEREEIKAENINRRKAGQEPYAPYILQNLGGNIKTVKDRIARLEKIDARPAADDIDFNGGKIVENTEANRIQIIFDDIPAPEIREQLKRSGFKWARSEGAWQRLRGNYALYIAKDITSKL
jgi:hypothetical protein